MKITTVKYMKRKNLGNYEHEECQVEGMIEEGESPEGCILRLKTFVEQALEGTLGASPAINQKVEAPVVAKEEKPAPQKRAPKAAKPAAPAQEEEMEDVPSPFVDNKTDEGQDVPPVIPTEAAPKTEAPKKEPVKVAAEKAPKAADSKPGKGIVNYDASVKEHRSRFATYLGNTYPKWTPDAKFGKETQSPEKEAYKASVQEFSKGLHGLPFEDARGNMLESFKAQLESFFGAK